MWSSKLWAGSLILNEAISLGDVPSLWTLPALPSLIGRCGRTQGSSQDLSTGREQVPRELEFLWHLCCLYWKYHKNSFFMLFQLKTGMAAPQARDGEGLCLCSGAQPAMPQVAWPRCIGHRPGFLLGYWAWGMRVCGVGERCLSGTWPVFIWKSKKRKLAFTHPPCSTT